MSSPLAVLGGMFDPVHNGHIEAARFAIDKLAVNRLKMVPCKKPNHKQAATADARHRLAMLQLAVAVDDKIEVDPIEIRRAGVSYALDTLLELKKSEDTLVFVLGIDSFNTLPQWHRWSELTSLCHFLVLARSGTNISSNLEGLLKIEQRLVRSPEQMFSCDSGKIMLAEDFSYDASSTGIREKLSRHEDVSAQMDEQVLAYINENHLYA